MNVNDLRDRLSPRPFPQWAHLIDDHRVTDGRAQTDIVEWTAWGWLHWKVNCRDWKIGNDNPYRDLRGRVHLAAVSVAPILTASSPLRRLQMRASQYSATRYQISDRSYRIGEVVTAACALPAALGGMLTAVGGPTLSSTALVIGGAGAATGWRRCLTQGRRQVRQLGPLRPDDSGDLTDEHLELLVDIADLFTVTQHVPAIADLPVEPGIRVLLWDLLDPHLTADDLEYIQWQTIRLRNELEAMRHQQQLAGDLMLSVAGSRSLASTRERNRREAIPPLLFNKLVDEIAARAYGLQVANETTGRALLVDELTVEPTGQHVDPSVHAPLYSQILAVSPLDTELVVALVDYARSELTVGEPDTWTISAAGDGHYLLEVASGWVEDLLWLAQALTDLQVPADRSVINDAAPAGSRDRQATFQQQLATRATVRWPTPAGRPTAVPVPGSATTEDLGAQRLCRARLIDEATQLIVASHAAAERSVQAYFQGEGEQVKMLARLQHVRHRYVQLREQYRATGRVPGDSWPYAEDVDEDPGDIVATFERAPAPAPAGNRLWSAGDHTRHREDRASILEGDPYLGDDS